MPEELLYQKSADLMADSQSIIESAQRAAYRSVDFILVMRNWLLGKRIAEENMSAARIDRYGSGIIRKLAEQLTEKYGKGFDSRALYRYVKFYQLYPRIVGTLSPQSPPAGGDTISGTASPQSFAVLPVNWPESQLLSWSHYERLLQVADPEARAWYEKEAVAQSWSVRTLRRNVDTQYYERIHLSANKPAVEEEMLKKAEPYQHKYEFLNNPIIAEFLGMEENRSYHESELEQNIISNLEKFMMELGKGFAFVERQQHIHTNKDDYYIDLVFYNFILKCFVLIDLKMGRITHQDVGQMDMYVRMYDELRRRPDDNPTLGIVLCSETDEDIARYSVLHGNEQLFATKYRLCLPTEEQLRSEIESQKEIFYLQHPELNEERNNG